MVKHKRVKKLTWSQLWSRLKKCGWQYEKAKEIIMPTGILPLQDGIRGLTLLISLTV